MAHESVILKTAYSQFEPDVALDFHEYYPFRDDLYKLSSFGIMNAYDCMFLYSNNLNVPLNIRTITDTLFVENARRVLSRNELRYYDYFSTSNNLGVILFNVGSTNARSSATSYSLTNAFSSIIEVRGITLGRTSFKRRINTTFLVGISYLETAFNNDSLIKDIISNPVREIQEIVIKSESEVYKDTISAIDLDTKELINLEVSMINAKRSIPKLTRSIPDYYLLLPEQFSLVEKMNILGIKVDKLEEDTELIAEAYQIVLYNRDDKPIEKMRMQKVETEIFLKKIVFPKGTFKISTNQRNAGLLFEVLEPEAPNSFISFGVLDTELNQELPIYRLHKQ